jgi:PIN domain nuclease of toxin-antitoxin system
VTDWLLLGSTSLHGLTVAMRDFALRRVHWCTAADKTGTILLSAIRVWEIALLVETGRLAADASSARVHEP